MKTLKHSRQRDSIKDFLQSRIDHPTADAVFQALREESPNISLGTVYRNLNLLVELGEVQKLACGDGKDHFDWNTEPHYHFVCRCCGAVQDVAMDPLTDLETRAGDGVHGQVESHTVYFYGVCEECLEKREKLSS
ncbi:MAG: transcriptional repressor [Clostridiales bacterium]|nr:transcriptional repressor [Clostridiales bacterium]